MTTWLVVVNYESARHVERLLADASDCRVHVYDNGSSEADRRHLERMRDEHPGLLLTLGERNVGFGAGMNRAVGILDLDPADTLILMNPDMTLGPECLPRLTELVAGGEYAIASPLILQSRQPRAVWFAGGEIDLRAGRSIHWYWGRDRSAVPAHPYPTHFMSGAAPAMRAATWQALKGFREDFFLYWEDADLSLRAERLGLRLAVHPQALAWHQEGGSQVRAGRGPKYYYYMQRNRMRIMAEYAAAGWLLDRRALVETLKLLARPLFEPSNKARSFVTGVRGLAEGLRSRRVR